ncbi:hypothetical protein I8748_23385 [Nostoc sp. CENA67]|uniref:Uncharacterized protein n=1 Tax=Amazonocrinis nigriterrae CENA67 TaxID=2794033 RepID=A0A8J7LAJ9_9NOST|nr:hypothetical protein [Amazonocrinis nigriterrae]MBH8565090.1 hypothetical protein [Amazonocrinis nigriterrae CENA67]
MDSLTLAVTNELHRTPRELTASPNIQPMTRFIHDQFAKDYLEQLLTLVRFRVAKIAPTISTSACFQILVEKSLENICMILAIPACKFRLMGIE